MTFKQAKDKLKKIAQKEYCSLRFSEIIYEDENYNKTNCEIFLNGYKWHQGNTWEEAFDKLNIAMNPKSEEILCQ